MRWFGEMERHTVIPVYRSSVPPPPPPLSPSNSHLYTSSFCFFFMILPDDHGGSASMHGWGVYERRVLLDNMAMHL